MPRVALLDAWVEAFPEAEVGEHPDLAVELPDQLDAHVVAAAAAGAAEYLVTFNVRHFSADALAGVVTVRVITPDQFLLVLLGQDAQTLRTAVEEAVSALKRPPIEMDEFLEGLAELAPDFVSALALGSSED